VKPRGVLPFRDASQARGPLLTPQAVADLIGGVSEAWVRRNVPGKLRLGQRTVRWYRQDVLDWIETRLVTSMEVP
jgi:predicted DNA-binding transcriptional regulator AlpA